MKEKVRTESASRRVEARRASSRLAEEDTRERATRDEGSLDCRETQRCVRP